MSKSNITEGVHHVGLTVPCLSDTGAFFVETLGFRQVGERPDYPAIFVSDGTVMITLWQAVEPESAVPFDRKHVIGLHHLALKVDGSDALDELHEKLKATDGVEIEFSPEPLRDGPTRHMMCSIPGGIRLEFIAPTV